jgi:hypothetical protein
MQGPAGCDASRERIQEALVQVVDPFCHYAVPGLIRGGSRLVQNPLLK